MRSWEAQKAAEREARAHAEGRRPSVLDGVALALPALLRAEKLQKRAARVGFDWPDRAPVFDKVLEEVAEVREAVAARNSSTPPESRVSEEVGDLLFACVNLARHLGVEPEGRIARRQRQVHGAISAMWRRRWRTRGAMPPQSVSSNWTSCGRRQRKPTSAHP